MYLWWLLFLIVSQLFSDVIFQKKVFKYNHSLVRIKVGALLFVLNLEIADTIKQIS